MALSRPVIALAAVTILAGCGTPAPPAASVAASPVRITTPAPASDPVASAAGPSTTPAATPEPAGSAEEGDWRPVPTQDTVATTQFQQVFHAASTGDELLATGPSSGCPGGIWASTDGRSWACAAGGERIALFGAYDAAGSATIEIAAGLTNEGYDEDGGPGLPGAVWWRPRSAPVP